MKYQSILAGHRLDIGRNTEFKITLTPQNEKPVCWKSLPNPTNLTDHLLVEPAVMKEHLKKTTLPLASTRHRFLLNADQTVS